MKLTDPLRADHTLKLSGESNDCLVGSLPRYELFKSVSLTSHQSALKFQISQLKPADFSSTQDSVAAPELARQNP